MAHENSLNMGPLDEFPEGFPFTPNSAIRQYADPATFLLYPAAASYMAAEPALAAGVEVHSSVRTAPIGRLLGTVNAAVELVFGNEDESAAIARRLHTFHHTVAGETDGIEYQANDSNLQAWVLVCLQKVAYDETTRRWIDPQWGTSDESIHERKRLWSDIRTFGEFFGIRKGALPTTIDEVDEYWDTRLNSGTLLTTELSKNLTTEVVKAENSRIPKQLGRIIRAITVTSLDDRLLEPLDLRSTEADLRTAKKVDATMRNAYSKVPRRMRAQTIPQYMAFRRRNASVIGKLSALASTHKT
jgi:uncharacterized protein (DUF2236 family)